MTDKVEVETSQFVSFSHGFGSTTVDFKSSDSYGSVATCSGSSASSSYLYVKSSSFMSGLVKPGPTASN